MADEVRRNGPIDPVAHFRTINNNSHNTCSILKIKKLINMLNTVIGLGPKNIIRTA